MCVRVRGFYMQTYINNYLATQTKKRTLEIITKPIYTFNLYNSDPSQ
jgi:hypothetical protein